MAAFFAGPAAGQQGQSPYERIESDRETLIRGLSELEMTALLDAYHQRELSGVDSEASLRYLLQRNIMLAGQAGDSDRRAELLDQAIGQLRRLIEMSEQPDPGDLEAVQQYYSDRLQLAQLLGRQFVEPYVLRLLYLQGTDRDKQVVLDRTAEALEILDQLRRGLDDWLMEVQSDSQLSWDMMITGATDQMQHFRDRAGYQGAWVGFNRALAMEPELMDASAQQVRQQRHRLLTDAIAEVVEYAEGDPGSGVKWWSLLLCGMSAGQLGEFGQAAGYLSRLDDDDVDRVVRMRGAFELGKVYIRQQRWSQAQQQIQHFRAMGEQQNEAGRAGVAMQVAFLENYFYRRRAAEARAAGDADAAQAFELQAQQPFVDFLQQYPQYQRALLRLIVGAYEDVDDPAELSSLVLVGKGLFALSGEGSPEDAAKAQRFLQAALDREDPAAEMLRPLTLLNLGLALNRQDQWRESARMFLRVAQEHPDHPQAKIAATSAVKVLDHGVRTAEDVSAADVRAYADALETLLSDDRWFQDPQVQGYAFHLARLRRSAGEHERALQWFRRTPRTSEDYWLARYYALDSERKVLREMGPDELPADARRDKAVDLLRRMRLFIQEATAAAGDLPADKREDLRALAAQTDLAVAEILKDELNQGAEALAHIRGVRQRWPDQPEIGERAQALEVGLLIEQDQLARAIERLEAMPAERAQTLVTFLVSSVRERINQLERRGGPDAATELRQRRQDYRRFAEQAYAVVRDEAPQRRYPFRQMLAEAMMETGDPDQALEIFGQLHQQRPDDARNIHGLARSHCLLGNYDQALQQYSELVNGLDRNNPDHRDFYWKSQLEWMQCAAEAFWDDPQNLRRLRVKFRQLRSYDQRFGGFAGRFADLDGRVEDRLEQVGAEQ